MATGPRVGGAHVDVNLQFDEKSLDAVGKRIHTQLTKVAARNRKVYQSIGKDAVTAWRAALGSIVTGAPLIGSAFSGAAGAATMLAGSIYSLSQTTFALYGVLGSVAVAVGTAKIGFEGFGDAIRETDPEKLTAALENLSPSARASALAVRSLKDEAHDLRMAVQERMFAGLNDEISELSTTLFPVMQRGLVKMAGSLNRLFGSLLRYANSKAGLQQISGVLDNSAAIFDKLAKAAVPFLDGMLRLFNALAPSAKRLADRIAEVATKFQSWTKAEGFGKRMDDMMKRAEKTGGLLLSVLKNLGGALSNVFGAANPATNTFLQMLVDVTQRFQDWSASVGGQSSIATWAEQSVEVMRAFGKALEAVFKVTAELADPRVIISFLTTVENAFTILGDLPLDKMVDAFVGMAEALQPISGYILAFVISAASLNILLGSLIGQVAGFAAGIGRMTGLFKPLASAGKHGKELTGLSAAFARIAGVVARFVKFVPFVGWAVWIGMLVKKSDKLQAKMGELWGAVKGFGQSFVDAFKEIGDALTPLAPVAQELGGWLGELFDIIDSVAIVILGNALGTLIDIFKGLGTAVQGVGKVIAGIVNIWVGIFTEDTDKILGGLRQLGSGILKIFLGLGQAVLAPVMNAFKTVGEFVGDGFIDGLKSIGKAIKDFGMSIINGVKSVLGISSPSTVFKQIGVWVVKGLISGIQSMMGGIKSTASRLVTGLLRSVSTLPKRLMNLGRTAVSRLGNAFSSGIGLLKGIAGKISNAVTNGLKALPGLVIALGNRVINGLTKAISGGVSLVKNAAGKIKPVILGAFSGAATWLKNIGSDIIHGLGAGLDAAREWLKGKIEDLSGWIPGWIKKKLGISSPSKVMAELAKWIPAGIAQGILAGIPGVQAAMDAAIATIRNGMEEVSLGKAATVVADTFNTVNEKISASFERQLDRRNKAADKRFEKMRVAILQKFNKGSKSRGTGDPETDTATAKKQSEATQAVIQRHLDALAEKRKDYDQKLKASAKKAQEAINRIAQSGRQTAMALGNAWDEQALRLENLKEPLEEAKTALGAARDKFNSILESVRDSFKKNIFEAGSDGGVPPTFAAMIKSLEDQKKRAEEFARTFAQLRDLGLNEESLRQFAAQGEEGLAAALALLNEGGADGVARINELQKAVSDQAEATGNLVADTLEGASVEAAKALVEQLLEDEAVIKEEMIRLGEAMADAFRDALRLTKVPSGGGGGGGGGGGSEKNKPHPWEPKGKSQKCAICGRSRENKIHTNRKNNNATGTGNYPGGWGLLGEFGPEFVRMPAGSQVRSASRSERMMGRQDAPQQPVTVNQNYYGPQTGSEKLRELEWTLKYATGKRR